MKYKRIFKNILYFFKYKYHSCNFEETITLKAKNGTSFEILIESNSMTVVVENNSISENYIFSKEFKGSEKEEIKNIINSIYDINIKLGLLSRFFEKHIIENKLNT